MKKYSSLTARYQVIPLAFETLGHWGPAAIKLVTEIGHKIKLKSFEPRATEFLKQRLSICIQRGNACSVLGTVGHTKAMDEVFYL